MSAPATLPRLSDYPSAEERWLAAVATRLDALIDRLDTLVAVLTPSAPIVTDMVALQEPVLAAASEVIAPIPAKRRPGRPRKAS